MISELDDHGFEDTSSTRKVAVLNDAVADVCSREPWQFMEASTDTFALSVRAPTLPANFRAALTLIIPSLSLIIQPERTDTITKMYPAALLNTGTPNYYYFVGSEMRLLPVPDKTYTATLFYLQHHPVLTAGSLETDILIPVRHHRVVVLGALSRLYAMEDDPELGAIFNAQYEARLQTMEADSWKKQYDRPDRVIDIWGE